MKFKTLGSEIISLFIFFIILIYVMEEIKNILHRIKNFYIRLEDKDVSVIEEYNNCIYEISKIIESKSDEWLLDNSYDLRSFVFKMRGLTKIINKEFECNEAINFSALNYTKLEEKIRIKATEEYKERNGEVDF